MINDILSQISAAGGVSRPNKFSFELVPPRIVAAMGSSRLKDYFSAIGIEGVNSTKRLKFMCNRAELPGKSFNTSDIRTYGSSYKIPHVDSYSDLTAHFIVGRDMYEKDFFDAWSYTVQDPVTADFNYVNDYSSTVDIYQLDEFDNANYGVRLYQSWPLAISPLALDYNDRNTFHILPVTFTYRKWINLRLDKRPPTTTNIQPNPNSDPGTFGSTISRRTN